MYLFQVKVLDIDEEEHLTENRPGYKSHRPPITGRNNSNGLSSYAIWQPCLGWAASGKTQVFKDKCLALSCIVGEKLIEIAEIPSEQKRKMLRYKMLHRKYNYIWIEIEKRVAKLYRVCPLLSQSVTKMTLPEVIKQISLALDKQIYVYFEADSTRVPMSFPKYPTPSKPSISLLLTTDDSHICLIKDLKMFWNNIGYICLYCHKSSMNFAKALHRCLKKKSTCTNCRRHIMSQNSYKNYESYKIWCEPSDSNLLDITCKNCNFSDFVSQECFENHKRVCCLSYKCNDCGQFSRSSSKSEQDEIRKNHVCGLQRCYLCKYSYKSNTKHVCRFLPPRKDKTLNRLCFFSLTYKLQSENCENCFENDSCQYHEEENFENKPNFAILTIEEEQENFCTYTSFDSALPGEPEEIKVFYSYLPSNPNLKYTLSEELPASNFGQPSKANKNMEVLIGMMLRKQNKSIVETLILKLLNKKCKRTVITDSFDTLHEILKTFTQNKIPCKIKRSHGKLSRVENAKLGLIFLAGHNFLPYSAFDIIKMVTNDFIFFPLKLNERKYYQLNEMPDFSCFTTTLDSTEEKEKKKYFYDSRKNLQWNFFDNLKTYCLFKHNNLLLAFVSLLHESLAMLEEFHKYFQRSEVVLVSPYNCFTLASYSFMCLRSFGFKSSQICCLSEKEKNIQASKQERQLAHYLSKKVPSLITNFSSQREKLAKFSVCHPDFYDPTTKTAYEYSGCYFHSHICKLTSKEDNQHALKLKEIETRRKRREFCNKNRDQVKDIVVVNECWFRDALKFNPNLAHLKKISFDDMTRLNPRDTYRQPLTEVYNMFYQRNSSSKLYRMDINSQFGNIMTHLNIPMNDYRILIDKEVDGFGYSAAHECYTLNDGAIFFGMIKLVILPPESNNLFPIIPYKNEEGRNIYINCKSCYLFRKKTCNHDPDERAFCTTITSTELNYSYSQGYKAVVVYELFQFDSYYPLLSDFYTFLLKKRTEGLGWQRNMDNDDYLFELNNSQPFQGSKFIFHTQEIKKNEIKRKMVKMMINYSIGMFGVNLENFQKHKITFDPVELKQEFRKGNLYDFHEITEDTLEMILHCDKKKPLFMNSNCLIPALCCAESRISIHKNMLDITQAGGTVYLTNFDSILYSLPVGVENPLPISEFKPGFFKQDGNIPISFVALSNRFYSILYENQDTIERQVVINGLNMATEIFQQSIQHNQMIQNLEKAFLDKTIQNKIKHVRGKRKMELNYTHDLFKIRYGDTSSYQLYPYGYVVNPLYNSESESETSEFSDMSDCDISINYLNNRNDDCDDYCLSNEEFSDADVNM